MAKQLVGRDNVEQFICHEEKKLYVGKMLILTPGAKDYLREKSIAVVYGEAPVVVEKPIPKAAVASGSDLNNSIQQLLKNDFSITDNALVAEVTQKVMEKLERRK